MNSVTIEYIVSYIVDSHNSMNLICFIFLFTGYVPLSPPLIQATLTHWLCVRYDIIDYATVSTFILDCVFVTSID